MKRILIAALAIVIVCVSLALGGCAESGLMENKSIIFHVYNGSKSLICDNGKNLDYIKIDDYSEYIEFANSATRWMKTTNEDGGETVPQYAREEISGAIDDYSRQFFADNSLIVIEYINHWQMIFDISVEEICLGSEVAEISLYIDAQGVVGSNNRAFLFVPVSKTDAEAMENIRLIENRAPAKDFAAKPIIYLYPETELSVDVTLGYKDKITVSYPEYIDGWSVTAQP
ncbi:MAG: hypothetical protein IKY44_00380, partial [Clostridia bacterium]|nr:hypothetical protein [Clostridia bacterium]